MNSLMQVMFASIRGKFVQIYTKLRMLLNPAYFKARFTGKLREFFIGLFNIRPRSQQDYYTVGKWMLGKKLAFAVIITMGVLSLWFISSLLPARTKAVTTMAQGGASRKYSSFALKKYTGQATVLARKGYVAYVGQLTDGLAQGEGTLYSESGAVVYAGTFSANTYNGQGKLYYPNADLHYEGAFTFNRFNGKGKLYAEGGRLSYEGEFENGLKNGTGDLYDTVGQKIFTGRFYRDSILFTEFLGKPVSVLGAAFTGTAVSYRTDTVSCSAYPQLQALFELKSNSESLEDEVTVKRLFLCEQSAVFAEQAPKTALELDQVLGKPFYEGNSAITFSELAAVSQLRRTSPDAFPDIAEPAFEKPFDEVRYLQTVPAADQIYMRSYQKDGLLYTFYFPAKSEPYGFYAIEADSAPPALTDIQ